MSVAESHAPEEKAPVTGTAVAFLIAGLIVAAMASATIAFGLPGLAMVALTMVPVIYAVLLILTFGK